MKKIAVILSGCGHRDGAEITEAVSVIVTLSELGTDYHMFAPALEFEAINHLTQKESGSQRDVLTEAARIARGQIKNITELKAKDFDGLAMPGGFGAASRLSTWGKEGAKCTVLPEVERVLNEFYNDGKPIGAVCIAPAVVARVLGHHGVSVTLGNKPENAKEIEKTGAVHEDCAVDDFISDREHKIITSPAYMYDAKPHLVFLGIQKAIREMVEMA